MVLRPRELNCARLRRIAGRLIDGRLGRLRLAAGVILKGKSNHEHQGSAERRVPNNGAGARPRSIHQSRPVAGEEAAECPAQRCGIILDIVEFAPHRVGPWRLVAGHDTCGMLRKLPGPAPPSAWHGVHAKAPARGAAIVAKSCSRASASPELVKR
jgi:hypothetical protein